MNFEYTWPDKHDIQYFLTPLQNHLEKELEKLYGEDLFSFVRDLVSGRTMYLIGLDQFYADLIFGWPEDEHWSVQEIPDTVVSDVYVLVDFGYQAIVGNETALMGLSYLELELTPEQLLILRSLT